MWTDIISWWKALWTEQKIVAGALSGFIAAFIMFLIKDALWQSRFVRIQRMTDFRQKQLDNFYSPLYQYYQQAYARFDYWKKENATSELPRQPFFDSTEERKFEEKIFTDHSGYASQQILQLWSAFNATSDNVERNKRRELMVRAIVKDYQKLKKQVGLENNEEELKTGTFKLSSD